MRLVALGGLELIGSGFRRTKLLLVLCYLALEGPKHRGFLAELFWRSAANPANSVAKALTLLRGAAPGSVELDGSRVRAAVTTDVALLLTHLERNEIDEAMQLYRGAFLDGVHLNTWPVELEEWVLETRESLAVRVQRGLLRRAEGRARAGRLEDGARDAQRAWRLPGLSGSEEDALRAVHRVLIAAESVSAAAVEREAASSGIDLHAMVRGAEGSLPQWRESMTEPTSFVGRRQELAWLRTRLSDAGCRLVTLTGAGGSGKTRLALRIARELAGDAYAGGLHFVRLEAVKDPRDVEAAIVRSSGLAMGADASESEAIAESIGSIPTLLVLDNFEQVRPAAPRLSSLLRSCPHLKILVTSRERLGLADEWILPVAGLALEADARSSPAVDGDGRSDAVRLFVARARQVNPAFRADLEVEHVRRICELVGGSPLGIELAAAWTRAATCERIAQEIARDPDFLGASHSEVEPRQRSVRALFEHSWRLLSPAQGRDLARASVFRGGFDARAASKVADLSLAGIASLVDASLIEVATGGRYRLHPLVQAFAREKAAEEPEEDLRLRNRFADHYLSLLEHHEHDLWNANQWTASRTLADEFDNLRAAWGIILARGDARALRRAAHALTFHCELQQSHAQGMALLEQAIVVLDSRPGGSGLVEVMQGLQSWLLLSVGRSAEAERLGRAVLPPLRAAGDLQTLLYPLVTLGSCAHERGDARAAEAHFTELLATARAVGELRYVSPALHNLAQVAISEGRFGEAEVLLREALDGFRRQRNDAFTADCLGALADVLSALDRLPEAREVLLEALRLVQRHDHHERRARVILRLARIEETLGDEDSAALLAEEVLGAVQPPAAVALEAHLVLGRLAVQRGDAAGGVERFRTALSSAWQAADVCTALSCLAHLGEHYALHHESWARTLLEVAARHPLTDVESRGRALRALDRRPEDAHLVDAGRAGVRSGELERAVRNALAIRA